MQRADVFVAAALFGKAHKGVVVIFGHNETAVFPAVRERRRLLIGAKRGVVQQHGVADSTPEHNADLQLRRVCRNGERRADGRPVVRQIRFLRTREHARTEVVRDIGGITRAVKGIGGQKIMPPRARALHVDRETIACAALDRNGRGADRHPVFTVHMAGRFQHAAVLAVGCRLQRHGVVGVVDDLPAERLLGHLCAGKAAVEIGERQIGINRVLKIAVFDEIDRRHQRRTIRGEKIAAASQDILTRCGVRDGDVADIQIAQRVIAREFQKEVPRAV